MKEYKKDEFSKFIEEIKTLKDRYISKILISFEEYRYLIKFYISSKCPQNEIDGLYNKTILKLLMVFKTLEIDNFKYEIVMEDVELGI